MGIYLQKRSDGSTYGTYVIDRVIDGRRLKLATGSRDLRTARRIADVLNQIIDSSLEHHIKNLLSKKITIRQLYDLQQRGLLNNRFHDPESLQPLEPSLSQWIASYKGYSPKTRKSNHEFIRTFYKHLTAAFPTPTMEELPQMLRKYRDICDSKDTPRTFNLTRAVIFRYVKLKLGKQSELYQRTIDVEKLHDKPKRPQTARTPAEIARLTQALPDPYKGMVWTMCTLGVGWSEYGQISVNEKTRAPNVHIAGTKMDRKDERRRRTVPLILIPSERKGSERHFRKILQRAAGSLGLDDINIYTFRKCYPNWLAEAGIPQWRIEMYMGHQPTTQTQKYQMTDVARWLVDDARTMLTWIESAKKQPIQPTNESLFERIATLDDL